MQFRPDYQAVKQGVKQVILVSSCRFHVCCKNIGTVNKDCEVSQKETDRNLERLGINGHQIIRMIGLPHKRGGK